MPAYFSHSYHHITLLQMREMRARIVVEHGIERMHSLRCVAGNALGVGFVTPTFIQLKQMRESTSPTLDSIA